MNQYVVVSLVCDRGPKKEENAQLREVLTGSVTNPVFVLQDPFDGKTLAKFDYLQAKEPNLAEKIEQAKRRFALNQSRRSVVAK